MSLSLLTTPNNVNVNIQVGNLITNGSTLANGNVTVYGNTTDNGNVTVNGNTIDNGNLTVNGTITNNGNVLSFIPVAVGEVGGFDGPPVSLVLTSGVNHYVPSGAGGPYLTALNLPISNPGFTLVTQNVAQQLFVIKYSGYYNITYSIDFNVPNTGDLAQVMNSYLVTNFNGGPATALLSSICTETTDYNVPVVVSLQGNVLINMLAGDTIFGIQLYTPTLNVTIAINNVNVYAQLVSL